MEVCAMPRFAPFLPILLLLSTACRAESDAPAAGGVDWSEPIRVASGPAYQGPWRMNESEFLYVDDPALALSNDRTYMAWVDNADQNVFFQRFDADGSPELAEPVNVSTSGDIFSWLPRVAVAGERVVLAWEEILFTGGSHGGEILLACSSDGGRSFSEPVNLSNTTAGAGKGRLTRQRWDNGSLDVTFEGERVVVAWTEYEGALKVAVSSNRCRDFSEPVHVAGDDDAPMRAPSLAAGPDGRIWLAWTVGDVDDADIHLAYSNDPAAGFSSPRVIHGNARHADSPVVRADSEGHVHLAWTESDRAPFRNSRIVYARDADGMGEFAAPVTISGETTSAYPQMAVAGERVVVTWELAARGGARSFGIGHAISRDGGRNFSEPSEVPGTARREYGVNGGNQGLLMRKLDLAPDGRVALGHVTWLDGEASHIWLLHGVAESADR
jgi:hypothetical protein